MTWRAVLKVLVLGTFMLGSSCRERPERQAETTAIPRTEVPLGSASPARAAELESSAAAPSTSSAPAPSAAASGKAPSLPEYPEAEKPLSAPCGDPRVVLAVRKQFDRSGRLWVQQALLAHPEFTLEREKASKPMAVDVYETIYGTKNFGRLYPGQPLFSEAIIARCGDFATCNRLAAMFHAVAPKEKSEPVCGVPAATTGGFGRVAELAAERFEIPSGKAAPVAAVCARLHACAAREGKPLPANFGCTHAADPAQRECASAKSCAEVAACVAPLLK